MAIAMILVGAFGLILGGFSWTRSEKVVDFGPIEIARERRTNIPIPPLIGLAGLAVGVVLLARGK
jgi:hypothetical protein